MHCEYVAVAVAVVDGRGYNILAGARALCVERGCARVTIQQLRSAAQRDVDMSV